MQQSTKAIFFALGAIFCWSTVATAFKIALSEMDYTQLLFISSVTALSLFFIALIFTGKIVRLKQLSIKELPRFALFGFLNPFLYYLILFKAYSLLPAQIAQSLNCTWPLVLVLFSALFLKQAIPLRAAIGLFVSFGGVLLVSLGTGFSSLLTSSVAGMLLAVGSAFVWSTYWVINISNKEDEVVSLFLNFFFAVVYISLYMFFSEKAIPSGKPLFAAIYVGVFEMGITFLLWLKALKLAKTTATISQMSFLSPFISLLFIHFILHEPILTTTVGGLLLIVSGILINTWLMNRDKSHH